MTIEIEIDKKNILPQLAVAVQPGVDPNSGQWPADGGNSTFSTHLHFLGHEFCFCSSYGIEGINSRVFLLEESALQYTRSMSVGAPTSTPGIPGGTTGTPGIDYLGSSSYSYNHSAPFLQASSSESFFLIFTPKESEVMI